MAKSLTLAQARHGFIFTKKTEAKSDKTLEWYTGMLSRFEQFMATRNGTGNPALAKIGTEDVRQFIAHLQGQTQIWQDHPYHKPVSHPLSPQTIRGYVRGLSAFFTWAVADKLIAANPMESVKAPKTPKVIKEGFSADEIKRLLGACDRYSPVIAQRNKAIVLFLLDTGVRAHELVTLTLDSLKIDEQRALVHGKGAKDRYVSFGNLTAKALLYYVSERPPATVPSPFVFLTREGAPMTVGTLQQALRYLGQAAGVGGCHPHRFRSTAAVAMTVNGLNPFVLQQLMGHSDIRTTLIYVHLGEKDKEQAYRSASPVDRWNLK